jgi:hypothetical protein
VNAKQPAEFSEPSASRAQRPELTDNGFRQFRGRMPSLRDAIAHIIGVGSQKQMCWVHAPPYVAVVADGHPYGDWSVCQHPGDAVACAQPPIQDVQAIPILRNTSIPDPTCIRPSLVVFRFELANAVRLPLFVLDASHVNDSHVHNLLCQANKQPAPEKKTTLLDRENVNFLC